MTTAIIGLGNMGRGLARRLAGTPGLILATRDASAAKALAATIGAGAASIEQAVAAADTVVVALPYDAALAFAAHPALAGKILVDMSNPIKPDFSGLQFGHDTSAAGRIQAAAPGARVVKAYNTIFAQLFDAPRAATAAAPVFLAGDDEVAVDAVAGLVARSGFAPERTGALEAARLLESLGMLNIRMGFALGRGTAIAPSWMAIAA